MVGNVCAVVINVSEDLCVCSLSCSLLLCSFVELWTQHVSSSSGSSKAGDLAPPCVVGPEASNGSKALHICQQEYMQQLFADVLSFAGACGMEGSQHACDANHTVSKKGRNGCLGGGQFAQHPISSWRRENVVKSVSRWG